MPKTPHAPMPPVTAATLKETAFVKTVQILVKSGAIGRRIPETKSTCAELVLLKSRGTKNLKKRARSLEKSPTSRRRNGAPALVTAAASATGDAPAMGAIRTCIMHQVDDTVNGQNIQTLDNFTSHAPQISKLVSSSKG